MNIGIFTDTYTPQINGVIVSIDTLAKGLREKGHNVYIFSPNDPKLKDLENTDDNKEYAYRLPSIPVIFSPEYRFAVGISKKMYKNLKELNLDVIHTHSEFSLGLIGKLIAKKLNVPTVHTYHTMWADYAHYITRIKNATVNKPVTTLISKFSKYFCNTSNIVISPSKKTKNALIKYGVKKPILIIPTGIDLEPFREKMNLVEILKLKKEVGLKTMDKVILFIGRVAEEKSLDVLIKEFPKVLKKVPNAKFLIIGDGPAKNDLENLTRKLNLTNNIVFAGRKPYEMISKFYKLGDVFVNASTSETQGLTFIEAMAAGIPVVAKYDENLVGVINDNVSGCLFNENDEYADKVIKILNDKTFRNEIIKNASTIADSYSVENFVNKIEIAYQSVLKNK